MGYNKEYYMDFGMVFDMDPDLDYRMCFGKGFDRDFHMDFDMVLYNDFDMDSDMELDMVLDMVADLVLFVWYCMDYDIEDNCCSSVDLRICMAGSNFLELSSANNF